MAGKRVAVIGTGATGIQVIGEIADKVGELTVFQRRPNWSAPLNNGPISESGDGRHPPALRRDLRRLRALAGRLRARARPPRLLRGEPRGAAGAVGQALRRAGLRHLAGQLPRDLHRREGQRRVLRVHRRAHPPPGQGSQGRREADPARPRLRRAARADGDQLLRGLQPAQRPAGRHQRDAAGARHREGPAHHRARLRVRHHRLRHGLRRHHRRLRQDRHPGRGRREAGRQVAHHHLDLPRHDDPRLPEPADAGRAAKRLGLDQLSARHRDRRQLVHRPARVHAGQGLQQAPRRPSRPSSAGPSTSSTCTP